MRSPLPEVAEALGVPMEVAPAWLRAEGRPTFGCRTLEELKKDFATTEGLQVAISAQAVQEGYEKMALYAAYLLRTRRVLRSTTVRTYIVETCRCWPSALRTAPVRELLAGLESVSPALPEAAGVILARSVDRSAVMRWRQLWRDGRCTRWQWCAVSWQDYG